MEAEQVEEKSSVLETVVAILIAVATVIGAVVAWRASVILDASGDADYGGLRASVNVEETRALNYVNAYEHYGSFVAYSRYNELGNAIGDILEKDSANLSEEQVFMLQRQQAEAYDLAQANRRLFPHRFMNRDGSYSVQREMGELWADASKEKDLNPDPQYAEADALRQKSNKVLLTLMILAASLVFFTLVEPMPDQRIKYGVLALGVICMLGGTVAAILFELAR